MNINRVLFLSLNHFLENNLSAIEHIGTPNIRWCIQLTRLTHKIAIQLHPVADGCSICSSRSRRPVRKRLDTTSQITNPLLMDFFFLFS